LTKQAAFHQLGACSGAAGFVSSVDVNVTLGSFASPAPECIYHVRAEQVQQQTMPSMLIAPSNDGEDQ